MNQTQTLNKFVTLLNSLEQEYTIKYWEGGSGVDIVIPHSEVTIDSDVKHDYDILISINDTGYVTFEYESSKELWKES